MGSLSQRGRRLLRAAQVVAPATRPGDVTVLAYHLVDARTNSPVDLPEDQFREHLEILKRESILSLDDLVNAEGTQGARESTPHESWQGADRPRGEVVLTFDDAFANFVQVVLPLLEEAQIPATLYAPVGFVAGTSAAPLSGAEHLPAVSPANLRELAEHPLVSLGAHSWTHPDLRTCNDTRLEHELADARCQLEDWVGTPVEHFCYPRAYWNRRVDSKVRRSYRSATIGGGRVFRRGDDPLRIQRVSLIRDGAPLDAILGRRCWFEEWVANVVRRARRRRHPS